jgi:arginyl-tRNA synthetase
MLARGARGGTIPDSTAPRTDGLGGGQDVQSIRSELDACFRTAIAAALGEPGRSADPLIKRAQDPQFGDYQSNAAMGLAKQAKAKPRDVAQRIVDAVTQQPAFRAMCEPPEIAGPGFINLRIKPAWLAARLAAIPGAPSDDPDTDRLGIDPADTPETVVVDYSSPNVAKQMHVGHIRSTIIGDVIARVLAFGGHRVIRQNHVGDWGTQFGILIEQKARGGLDLTGELSTVLDKLEAAYRAGQAAFADDPAFADAARQAVARLQSGDPAAREIWQEICDVSERAFVDIYRRLNVRLGLDDVRGESFYNDRLADTVNALRKSLAANTDSGADLREDQGALCVFHQDADGKPRFKGPDGNALPMIVQKSDGAYLYATTDLAALRFRVRDLAADRIIYVTDARQTLHFEMLFATVRGASWITRDDTRTVRLDHVTFGSVLGEDRRPLKTRTGENVKLKALLDEAVSRAERLVRANEADPAKRRGFSEDQIRDIAEAVGIGAVKYADLAQDRHSDYVFNWDKMLALDGNTAPYMMYAYARIRSIYAKSEESDEATKRRSDEGNAPIVLAELAELHLAKRILELPDAIDTVAENLRPHVLTVYLFELAQAFSAFYEACPVLKADTPDQRASRMRLCDLTARALRLGLNLLGIRTVERM